MVTRLSFAFANGFIIPCFQPSVNIENSLLVVKETLLLVHGTEE